VPIDIFDTERPAPDRVFRYPVYERFLWVVAVVAAVAALVFRREVGRFLETEGTRGWAVLGVVVLFLLITIWVSLRAAISKVVISPVSLKARVFGQGIQRISWVHIQTVLYKWRPLGHKLIFVGSDGARVSFRSAIRGYEQLMGYVRESAPDPVLDQLEDIFGEGFFLQEAVPEAPPAPEEGPAEEELVEEQPAEEEAIEEEPEPPEPSPAPPVAPPPPLPAPETPPRPPEPEPVPPPVAAEAEAAPKAEAPAESPAEEAAEEPQAEEPETEAPRRKWWWVFLGK
jgi:hypothetical protein